jgi:hypothetical protein
VSGLNPVSENPRGSLFVRGHAGRKSDLQLSNELLLHIPWQVRWDLSLQRLPRHPLHGSLERKPSGIPAATIDDRGALVSSSFPSPDAGRAPAAPAKVAQDPTAPADAHVLALC